jgi:uncharacterized protein YcaQ
MESISTRAARRLALARAGLLKPGWTGLPGKASGRGRRARSAAHSLIDRFGYLQLDTVSIAGARSHVLVLLSRIEGFDPSFGEELLRPGEPLFEYWGHEACWLPMKLYPVFGFRREAFRHHPWWGDLIGQHPDVASDLVRRIRDEGPLRSLDMEGQGSSGWWDLKVAKKVATALWSSGELAIRERRNFQRTYDLAERVIPDEDREKTVARHVAFDVLLLRALEGHGWATTGTLARTWRLRNCSDEIRYALTRLQEQGEIVPCRLIGGKSKNTAGWIRPTDLELAARLDSVRPRRDRGVLLSPFDPVLWDRQRVLQLFGFHQVLEIFKPVSQRVYGYFCLPVLAGERLVARLDLKADRKIGSLNVLSSHYEDEPSATSREAVRTALDRFATAVGLTVA